jgi:hypothetical protein
MSYQLSPSNIEYPATGIHNSKSALRGQKINLITQILSEKFPGDPDEMTLNQLPWLTRLEK